MEEAEEKGLRKMGNEINTIGIRNRPYGESEGGGGSVEEVMGLLVLEIYRAVQRRGSVKEGMMLLALETKHAVEEDYD